MDPKEIEGRNSSDLYFEWSNKSRVPQHLIKIINSTTIELNIGEAYEKDSGLYTCYVLTSSGSVRGIGMTQVSVGYKPSQIEDFKCRSYNWAVMNCSFTKPLNPVPTVYTISYRLENNKGYSIPCNLTVTDTKINCIPSNYQKGHKLFIFTIDMVNDLGNYTQNIQIDNFASIIPAEPRNLTYSNLTSRSIKISWEVPYELIALRNFKEIDFVHEVQFCSEYDSKWIMIDNERLERHQPSTTILYYVVEKDNLQYANAWYEVRVRIRTNIASEPDNMWSTASILNFRTKSRKPDRPPKIDPGAFYVNDYNEVTIYWKELLQSKRNGNNTHYIITSVKKDGRAVGLEPTIISNTMAKFSKIDPESDYEFTVKSKNDDGDSDEESYIRVPAAKRRLAHPLKLKKSSLGNKYHLTWEPSTKILEQGRVKYTVFWCRPKNSLNNACDGGFDFAIVDQEKHKFELEKNESVNFAIAVTNTESSSGMSWTMCTAALPDEIGQIKTIWVKDIKDTRMEIEWKLECEDALIVQRYNISYCPLKSIIDPKRQDCKQPEIFVNVSSNVTKYNIVNLKPYTTYKITISMYSETRQGPPSKALENTTLEAAPSRPRGFKAYDVRNTSMMLEWQVPEYINGVLMYYEVFYNQHSIKIHDVKNDTNKEPYEVMRYHLQNLTSYTQYELVVKACTRYCSENSDKDLRTTGVGIPGNTMQPITKVNDSFVEISWQEPLFRGGHIEYYELKTIRKRKDYLIEEKITKICGIHTTCRRAPLCADGSEIYEFYVRPVNVIFSPHAKLTNITCAADSRHASTYVTLEKSIHAEAYTDNSGIVQKINHHEKHTTRHNHQSCDSGYEDKNLVSLLGRDQYALRLPGNWSKPSVTNCFHTAGIDGKTIATIICTLAMMLTMVVVSVKVYKKIKDMKNIVIVLPPGLEGITEEVKQSDLEKKSKPDANINDLLSTMFINGGEQDRLLRKRAESNSSNRSQTDGSQSGVLEDSVDDNTCDAQQLMEDDLQSVSSGQIEQDFKVKYN